MFARKLSVPCSLLLLLVLAGCGATPIEKAYTTSTLYSLAQQDLLAVKPKISQAVFDDAADADKIAAPLVIEMNRAAVEAQAENIPLAKAYNFNVAWTAAKNAVDVFLTRVTTAKNTTATATTTTK